MKILKGKIVSIKMSKTVTVEVERFLAHPIYKKRFKRNKKYQVHSEKQLKIGEVVKFVETRPISKTKRWRILEK
ncbi:MAG: 30S ribosomal protein S17 [Candidatus Woesebacteria bacterium]|nr:30S ribosomal protein S17 [Candidatus Woesebacteria bacterium]